MNTRILLHEQRNRRMAPFWWIAMFEMLTFCLLLALALIFGPVILLYYYQNIWTYLSLLLIPAGILLSRASFKTLRTQVWRNRNLSTYSLFSDGVEAVVHDETTRQTQTYAFRLEDIDRVYFSQHLIRDAHAFKKAGWFEQVNMYALLPVLHIRYRDIGGMRLLSVPFWDSAAGDVWLNEMRQRSIPIWATLLMITGRPEAEKLELLADDTSADHFPFRYESNLDQDFKRMVSQIREERLRRLPANANTSGKAMDRNSGDASPGDPRFPLTKEHPDYPHQPDSGYPQHPDYTQQPGHLQPPGYPYQPGYPGQQPRRARFFATPKLSTLLNLGVSGTLFYGVIRLVHGGTLSENHFLLPLLLLWAGVFVYFLCAEQLSRVHVFRYVVLAAVTWVAVGLAAPETEEDPAAGFMGISLISLAFHLVLFWVPYLLVKRLKQRADQRQEPGQQMNKGGGQP